MGGKHRVSRQREMQAAKTRERRAVHAGREAGKGLAGRLWEGPSETAKGSGLHHKHSHEGWSTGTDRQQSQQTLWQFCGDLSHTCHLSLGLIS